MCFLPPSGVPAVWDAEKKGRERRGRPRGTSKSSPGELQIFLLFLLLSLWQLIQVLRGLLQQHQLLLGPPLRCPRLNCLCGLQPVPELVPLQPQPSVLALQPRHRVPELCRKDLSRQIPGRGWAPLQPCVCPAQVALLHLHTAQLLVGLAQRVPLLQQPLLLLAQGFESLLQVPELQVPLLGPQRRLRLLPAQLLHLLAGGLQLRAAGLGAAQLLLQVEAARLVSGGLDLAPIPFGGILALLFL